jgi:phenol 2-monooxygenase
MAQDFSAKDRIFLCGDAAHTHSSGAAQGLNTGIHDAVNLGWKLALQIRGITKPDILETYSAERKTAVQKLIDYDKDISVLMSHKFPAWYKGDRSADPYILLGKIFEEAASFNTGLGIRYPENVLNQTLGASSLSVAPGSRPPDVELTMPGTNLKTRFQSITHNFAKFYALVFAGNATSTKNSLLGLKEFLASEPGKGLATHEAIEWITITSTVGCSPYEAIGMTPFGKTYFDPTNVAHDKFGVASDTGSVLIVRPDGLLGAGGPLEGQWVGEYFAKILDSISRPCINGANDVNGIERVVLGNGAVVNGVSGH